jgi:hypothetical protein
MVSWAVLYGKTMERHTPVFDLSGLPQEVIAVIRPFAEELVCRLPERIETLAVTGSCLTGDYIHGISNINTVLVLRKIDVPELDIIASAEKRFRKKLLQAPLVITEEYIRRSLDVFPIEFLDIKLLHKTICGPDLFVNLAIDKSPLRLQCERDLKGKLIHLRQGYIACSGKPRGVKALLLQAFPGFFPLLRAMLHIIQMHTEPPAGKASVLEEAESAFNIPMAGLKEILLLKTQKRFCLDHKRGYYLFTEVCRITHELSVAMDTFPA